MVTQGEIARRTGLDVSTVNKILNRKPGNSFRKETVERVYRTARKLGYDFGALKHEHCRRHPRKEVSLPTDLSVYVKKGVLYDHGTATIRNISLSGALVSDVGLSQGRFPAEPFVVGLRPMLSGEKGAELRGRMVRIVDFGGTVRYAIEFERSNKTAENLLRRFVQAKKIHPALT